jgi:Bax protein
MYNLPTISFPARLRKSIYFLSMAMAIILFPSSVFSAETGSVQSVAQNQRIHSDTKTSPEKSLSGGRIATMDKHSFFALMKPIVQNENIRILQIRQRLFQLKARAHLSLNDLSWLARIAKQYRVASNGEYNDSFWRKILTHVDVIPLEMALTQAANESAWGNSRFAREANNYFGQWCFRKGCGLVPLNRSPGSNHEIRRFDSVEQSVRSYMRNLNISRAYAHFRQMRRDLRLQRSLLDAEVLAIGLASYSERGMDYVNIIRAMIRANRKLIRLA